MARLSKKKVTKALMDNNGIIAQSAVACGVTRGAIYKFVNKWDMWDVVEEAREQLVDNLENKAIEIAFRGNNSMLQFLLKNQGRHRGYADRLEQNNTGDQTIRVIYDRSEPLDTSPDTA